jgi:long-chain acyl-CoA synthetase
MLRQNATKFSGRPALKYRKQGKFVVLSYAAFYERALMAARGLKKCNVKPGEAVAVLSENRVGWVIADMGILCAGGVTVAIYPTNTPEQIEYVLNHAEARVVFVSSKVQYQKLLKIRKAIPKVELVASFERFLGEPGLPVCTFYQLSEIDHPLTENEKKELEEGIDRIAPDDLLTLIYTSGTTGVPKGAMLTHRNILFDAFYTSKKAAVLSERDVHLSFLPLSHVLERTVGYYMTIMNGSLMAFADSLEKVPENMLEVKPTVSVSVPRLFEKIYSRIFENVHQMSVVKRKLFHWAVATGKQYVGARYIAKRISPFLTVKYAIADRLVFAKLRKRLGGNMRLFCCGGAPLDKTINEFFWIAGLPIFEGYGLTETSPAVCFNNFDQIRFGSVGTTLENTEVRADTDGELLIRGPQVMAGYYKDEKATSEAFQDGWFRTGDIGHIDNGFIFITDRKKELIITAGGKNIAPQPIENELKLDKYISQAFVYGDRKPYLTALLVPNLERLNEHAREKQIDYIDYDDLVLHEPVQKLYQQRVAEINSKLARYESIKKFVLLPRDFSIEGGELTPTLKLKRKVIYEKYKDKIEGMYADNSN